jgi:hypothetical protein
MELNDTETLEPASSRPAAALAPGSTPSTWVGAYVVLSVVGLALIRRSFRRFM